MELDENGNKIFGFPKFTDTSIRFIGKNNVLYFENNNIILENCNIVFKGDNSVIFIRRNQNPIKLSIMIYSDSAVYIGRDMWTTGRLDLNAGEARNILIGDECLFSSQCSARTTDSHMIYSSINLERENTGKSIFIGDHVWIAARVALLKGSLIHSGSIIGSDTVIANKEIISNTIWAGNPAKQIKDNIFFDKEGTHQLTNEQLNKFTNYDKAKAKKYIFKNDSTYISFNNIDDKLISSSTSEERLSVLQSIMKYSKKNRFALTTT